MTPEIVQRSFSNDDQIFRETFFDNQYKLKGHKEHGPIIANIGAGPGFFDFTALTLGAGKIYSFEPHVDNFNILLKNCYNAHFAGRVTPYLAGVYVNEIIGKFSRPNLIDNIFFDFDNIGLCTKLEEDFYPCKCFTLDTILENYCFNEHIDILKLVIGYAEKEILLGSTKLSENVQSVVGMIEATEEQVLEFKKQMSIRKFVNFYSLPPDEKGRVLFWGSKDSLSEHFVI
jgi:FkbM family methyltransferase